MTFLSSAPLTSRKLLLFASAVLLIGLGACSQGTEAETSDVEAPVEITETSSEAMTTAEESIDDTLEASSDIDDETTEVRQVGRHVHGVANLAMALDGSTLTVELDSPYYNLVGFEHAPETAEQTAAIKLAETTLSNPTALFMFNAEAGCVVNDADPIKLMAEAAHKDHDHDDHDHGSHDHDEETHADHGHEGEHEHAHDHDDGNSYESDHSHDDDDGHNHNHKDASLTYSFTCGSPDDLQWVETGLFDAFANLETVDFVYLGPSTQMSESLSSASGRIELN